MWDAFGVAFVTKPLRVAGLGELPMVTQLLHLTTSECHRCSDVPLVYVPLLGHNTVKVRQNL